MSCIDPVECLLGTPDCWRNNRTYLDGPHAGIVRQLVERRVVVKASNLSLEVLHMKVLQD